MTEDKKLTSVGIDAIQTLIKGLGDAAALGSDLVGGFSFKEIGELVALGQDVSSVLGNANQIIPQFADLDDTERATLMAYVSATVKFPANVSVQLVLEKILDAAIALSNLFKLQLVKA